MRAVHQLVAMLAVSTLGDLKVDPKYSTTYGNGDYVKHNERKTHGHDAAADGYEFKNGAINGATRIKRPDKVVKQIILDEKFKGGLWFDPSGGAWGEDGSPTNVDVNDKWNNDLHTNQQELARFDPQGTNEVFAPVTDDSFIKVNEKLNTRAVEAFEKEREIRFKKIRKLMKDGIKFCEKNVMVPCSVGEIRSLPSSKQKDCKESRAKPLECAMCFFLEDVTKKLEGGNKPIGPSLMKTACPGKITNMRHCDASQTDPDCKRNNMNKPLWTEWQEKFYQGKE
jgi:hypothetical protein